LTDIGVGERLSFLLTETPWAFVEQIVKNS
jgi:hypothetical protein